MNASKKLDKLARDIHYSLQVIRSNQYKKWDKSIHSSSMSNYFRYPRDPKNIWGQRFMNILNLVKYGNYNQNNSLETVKRKLQLMKSLKPREKALLTRLYDPAFTGIGQNVRNSTKIKPVLNWYVGILAKKYGVPVNWLSGLNGVEAIARSKPGRYIEYAIDTKYSNPGNIQYLTGTNRTIASKKLARKVSRVYIKALERRIATAKKAIPVGKFPSPIRKNILNRAFPRTHRHRSPSVGRTFQ